MYDMFSGLLGGRRNSMEAQYRAVVQHAVYNGQGPGLCEVCNQRPKYIENGYVHPYCGKTCARLHQPSCNHPYCNSTGKAAFGGYCGFIHATEAVERGFVKGCAECGKQPQVVEDLCLGCNNSTARLYESRLRELDLRDPNAASIIDNFNFSWKGSAPPTIGKIFEIRLPRQVVQGRQAYNAKVAAAGKLRQIETFHSAQCICDLGTNRAKFCTNYSCGICAIIKSAFTTFEFGKKSNQGRLGSGIYSYLDPSLADVWAVSTTSSPFRVMLECEVSLLPPRTKPPRFSSILQSREDGPVVCVSGAEAITPRYLILYTKLSATSPTASNGLVNLLH